MKANTSELSRRLARRIPIATPLQVLNAAICCTLFSLVTSVYTVLLFDNTISTHKDYRFGYFFRLETCTVDPTMIDTTRPIFLFDCIFSLFLPTTLSFCCLSAMARLPHIAADLFIYNKVHLRIVLKQLSTNCCDIAVPLVIIIFFGATTWQHMAITFYRLWLWDRWPYDTFPKCQRSSDVLTMLFPPICGVLLHVWCRDLVRKENGLYDPGPSLLSMAAQNDGDNGDSPHWHPHPVLPHHSHTEQSVIKPSVTFSQPLTVETPPMTAAAFHHHRQEVVGENYIGSNSNSPAQLMAMSSSEYCIETTPQHDSPVVVTIETCL